MYDSNSHKSETSISDRHQAVDLVAFQMQKSLVVKKRASGLKENVRMSH